ncbi:multiprotein-bridging factor 1 family protein [Streptosporangium sp. NPDC050855]|uniref:multiprotein-bridging factor 1 family protein n=1 Tax=Streptosporangium sp. NPDC050855 TaxID=3366194 RepID=UPI0037B1A328
MTSKVVAVDPGEAAVKRDALLVDRVRAAQLPPPSVRRRVRRSSRATLRDLASVLNVSPMTVLRWEQGKAEPRLEHAIAYRRLLDALAEAVSR